QFNPSGEGVVQFRSVAVNHHGGVGDGKVGELYRTNAGASDLEYGHINIRTELYVMNGQAALAGGCAGALSQLCGSAGHAEVAQSIVAPAVVNLQAFNANGCEVEQQDHVSGFPFKATVGDFKMSIELQFRTRHGTAVGQGSGRGAAVSDDQIGRADITLKKNVGEQVGAALRTGGGHAVDAKLEVHSLEVVVQTGWVAVIRCAQVDHQVTAVELFAVAAANGIAGQGIGYVGVAGIELASSSAPGNF